MTAPSYGSDAARKLIHGVINHGQQMLREEHRRKPVTYFCPQSGIGRGMTALEGSPRRIGILGLGCGTLAAYGRAGDTLRIYEINPKVLEIANRDADAAAGLDGKVLEQQRLAMRDVQPAQRVDGGPGRPRLADPAQVIVESHDGPEDHNW